MIRRDQAARRDLVKRRQEVEVIQVGKYDSIEFVLTSPVKIGNLEPRHAIFSQEFSRDARDGR